MVDYPLFKSEELSELVKELVGVEKELKISKGRRSSLDTKLKNNTFFWLLYYEFQVRYYNGFKEIDEWLDSSKVSGSKRYSGEFLETDQEAMEQLAESKWEINNRVGEAVNVLSSNNRAGVITNYNFTWAQVYNGGVEGLDNPSKISYKETNPEKVISGR